MYNRCRCTLKFRYLVRQNPENIGGLVMKRLIVGALLAMVAWMIGSQFNPWYAKWLGLGFGFLSGLALEDWGVTKIVLADGWHKFMSGITSYGKRFVSAVMAYESDWKGAFVWFLTAAVLVLTMEAWIYITPYASKIGGWLFALTTGILILIIFFRLVLVLPDLPTGLKKYQRVNPEERKTIKQEQMNEMISEIKFCACISPVLLPVVVCVAIVGFLILVTGLIFGAIKKIPTITKGILGFSWDISRFLTYSFLILVAREKTLTFAICVTVGAGMGMLLGKTIICGAIAAVTASGLIYVSDRTREWAENRLTALKQVV